MDLKARINDVKCQLKLIELNNKKWQYWIDENNEKADILREKLKLLEAKPAETEGVAGQNWMAYG